MVKAHQLFPTEALMQVERIGVRVGSNVGLDMIRLLFRVRFDLASGKVLSLLI